MTKNKNGKRQIEALRRLGVELKPDPNYYCHHQPWARDRCKNPPTKMREHYGVMQWFCAMHDPVRLYHEEKNRKKRQAEKKARWQQVERERKA